VREAGRKSSFFKYTISLEHQKKNQSKKKRAFFVDGRRRLQPPNEAISA